MESQRTDWTSTMALDASKIENFLCKLSAADLARDMSLVHSGVLLDIYGSRSLPWRIYLGLLSENPSNWASELAKSRKVFSDRLKGQSVKEKLAVDKNFNPLANLGSVELKKEREMRDLIKADVLRTCQEFEYFRRQSTKDSL